MLADFQICISVPLILEAKFGDDPLLDCSFPKTNFIHYSLVLLFYTPWKHQKTYRFSDVFRGYRKTTPGCNHNNYHGDLPPKLWAQFLVLKKNFFWGGWRFFHFKGGRGRESPYGGTCSKVDCEDGIQLYKIESCTCFCHFLNLARLYSYTIMTELLISLLLSRSIALKT